MANLIDKNALVAEIESRIKSMEECFNGKFPMSQSVKETEQDKGKLVAYKSILSFLDTLEVKEVDLEKEYDNLVVNHDCTNCALRLICKKEPKPKLCYDWKAPKDMGVDHVGQINLK